MPKTYVSIDKRSLPVGLQDGYIYKYIQKLLTYAQNALQTEIFDYGTQ